MFTQITETIPDLPNPNHIKVTFQNINGYIEKERAIQQIYTRLNSDIILFAHTNIAPPTAPINIHPYITHMHNTARYHSGVAILVKPHITHKIVTHNFRGDTLAIQVETSTGPIIIAVNYSPPHRQHIPIGDINWIARHRTPAYLLADLNARHRSFCSTTTAYGQVVYNEWLQNDRLRRIGPHIGTFHSIAGRTTKPDIILANNQTYHFHHVSTLPFNVSDHAPMCLEISARAIKIPCPEYELIAKADWKRYQDLLKEKFAPINFNLKETEFIENYLRFLTTTVNEVRQLTIPKSTFKYSSRFSTSDKFKRLEKIINEIHKLIELNAHNPIHLRNLNCKKQKQYDYLKKRQIKFMLKTGIIILIK